MSKVKTATAGLIERIERIMTDKQRKAIELLNHCNSWLILSEEQAINDEEYMLLMDFVVDGTNRDEKKLQHVYVFHDDEDGDIITDLWTCSVPDVGEYMIIWDKGAHHHYEVTKRIYGANAEEKVGVWNLYVSPKKKGKK